MKRTAAHACLLVSVAACGLLDDTSEPATEATPIADPTAPAPAAEGQATAPTGPAAEAPSDEAPPAALTEKDLVYRLNTPREAASATYGARDSAGNTMEIVSVIDLGSPAKYAAVYHSQASAGDETRLKIHLATSDDLVTWKYQRTLVDHADMPAIRRIDKSDWIVLAYAHWTKAGSGGVSKGPTEIALELFESSADLLAGKARSKWSAPKYPQGESNFTPNIFDARAVRYDGRWGVDLEIGHHYWTGSRFSTAEANITRFGTTGTRSEPSTPTDYHQVLKSAGASSNLRGRDVIQLAQGRYVVQDADFKTSASRRLYLYSYGDSLTSPSAKGSAIPLAPKTPNGSVAFGLPRVSMVKSPSGKGQSMMISYWVFADGAAAGEAGNLLYRFD